MLQRSIKQLGIHGKAPNPNLLEIMYLIVMKGIMQKNCNEMRGNYAKILKQQF